MAPASVAAAGDPEMVHYGEVLDFWRVVGLERDRRLVLQAEMKLPGEALIEFRIQARGEFQCMLQQRALFHPRGLFGSRCPMLNKPYALPNEPGSHLSVRGQSCRAVR